MSISPSELFRESAAEFLNENSRSSLGLLAMAITRLGLSDDPRELEKDVKKYREFANRFDMSLMELCILNEATKLLDKNDRKDFLLNPELFIPNFPVISELGRVIEEYDSADLNKLNESIKITYRNREQISMKNGIGSVLLSNLDLTVIGQLDPRAEKLKPSITSILLLAACKTITAISSESFNYANSRYPFRTAINAATEEAILNPGMEETFIKKLIIPGTDRKLTRSYLQKRVKLRK